MSDTAQNRLIARLRSLPRYNPLYVPDDLPWDDVFAAMKEQPEGMFVKWEDVVAMFVAPVGDVTVMTPMQAVAEGQIRLHATVHASVEIDYTATQQDLNAILVALGRKVLLNFEQQREAFFKRATKS